MQEIISKRRVLVIGLDGATWTALRPLMEQGHMPNLKRLVENGVSGNLASTIPAHSGPAWTSFMTGKNPGKHGIFGFTRLVSDGHPRLVVNSSKDIKSETIFQIMNKENKTVVSINLPVTYPPFKVNGAMISDGQLTPSKDCNFTYPADLFERIGWNKKDYILNIRRPGYYHEGQEFDLLRDINISTDRRAEFALSLMDKIIWDLFIIVFTETDFLQHRMLHYIDPSHPFYNDKFKSEINDYFFMLDKIILRLVERAGKDTYVFIVSDHGFGSFKGTIYINSLLRSMGLLKIKGKGVNESFINFQNNLRSFLNQKSLLYRYIKILIKKLFDLDKENKCPQDLRKTKPILSLKEFLSSLDWAKTKAYFSGDTWSTIFINSYKNINNKDKTYKNEKIQDTIAQILKEIPDPETKNPLNFKVYRKQEIYHGLYLNEAPDLVLDPNSGYKFAIIANSKEFATKANRVWNSHYREGILVMNGNNIKENKIINNASIMDIIPSILYILGLSIPDDIDGKVLKEAIKEEFLDYNPIVFKKSNLKVEKETQETIYSQEETSKIEKRLADLGYID